MVQRRKTRSSQPLWARILGVALGLLILNAAFVWRDIIGLFGLLVGVAFALVSIVAALWPAHRRS